MSSIPVDLMAVVSAALRGVDAPVVVRDLRRPSPPVLMALAAKMVMAANADPAYHSVVNVVGFPGGPWLSVVDTGRFGFTPAGGCDAYTYLGPPPDGVDPDDRERVGDWLVGELRAAVERHAQLAERARLADADKPGPVEARDAIRRIS